MSIEIRNIRIYDSKRISEPTTIVIENGRISEKTTGDRVIDGNGGTLLPGLIDAHVHLDGLQNLQEAAKYGITTMVDMSPASKELADSLRNQPGLSDIITSYSPAIYPIHNPGQYVLDRISQGAEFIKIVIEDPPHLAQKALDQDTISSIVTAAHKHNRIAVAHAATINTYQQAINAGVDVITHIPMTEVIPESMIDVIAKNGVIIIPTMKMMKEMIKNFKVRMPEVKAFDFRYVEQTVSAMIKAGITIVAGTDANLAPFAPANFIHGKCLHEELEMYATAGMTPADVIESATNTAANVFGLTDRGTIAAGQRADLILVDGDPTADIKVLRNIKKVWINGVESK
ncbi:amidohydrolase family protein [Lacrimispora brassicae]